MDGSIQFIQKKKNTTKIDNGNIYSVIAIRQTTRTEDIEY